VRGSRLAELAASFGGRVVGDGDLAVTGVAALADAGPGQLAFSTGGKHRKAAIASRAAALLVGERDLDLARPDRPLWVVEDPQRTFTLVTAAFFPEPRMAPGVHPTAVVDASVLLDPAEVAVGPYAVLGAGVELAAGVEIQAHAVVGAGCRLGAGTVVFPHAVLYPGCELGARCRVHAGAVVGADGFGYVSRRDGHHKVPHVGRVIVGDDVEIGANTTIDRAALGVTRVGSGSKIDNLVQVGHNVELGRGVLLCSQAGIAGSSKLGDGVVLAGQAGVADHLELGDGVQVGAASAVVQSVPAGQVVSATVPAIEIGLWRRQAVLLGRLTELFLRLRQLERRAGSTGREEGSNGE
jgi:UDP-3-O-[3-hydroxymyristoyl] glucosamine N-acyltransferase